MTVADLIAGFFAEKGCRHAFGVVGAGNMRIVDALARRGVTRLVCTHGEQAAGQAAIGYYRAGGGIAPVIVTCGGGASNVVTGVVSAWMDSVPMFVVAGQESRRDDRLRAYGVQGFCLSRMVVGQAKYSTTAVNGMDFVLSHGWSQAQSGRMGPVVLEVPMDVQGRRA